VPAPCAKSQSLSSLTLTRLPGTRIPEVEGLAASSGGSDGGRAMTGRRCTILIALTAVALFGFAAQALADTGAFEAVVALPFARILLGVASIAFTAALARGATR